MSSLSFSLSYNFMFKFKKKKLYLQNKSTVKTNNWLIKKTRKTLNRFTLFSNTRQSMTNWMRIAKCCTRLRLVNHLLRVFWPVDRTFSHPHSFADMFHALEFLSEFLHTIAMPHVRKPEAWKVHIARVKCLAL